MQLSNFGYKCETAPAVPRKAQIPTVEAYDRHTVRVRRCRSRLGRQLGYMDTVTTWRLRITALLAKIVYIQLL